MTWLPDVDACRRYLAGEPQSQEKLDSDFKPSRKTIYGMVEDGMKVARRGDSEPKRDSRGRLRQGRMIFSAEWVDEYLARKAEPKLATVQQRGAA